MTDVSLLTAAVLLSSYLIGAIPFGYLIARWRGVDILKQGSGNIGATNVGRVLGRPFGIVVFVLDFAKGAIPAALATVLSGTFSQTKSGAADPNNVLGIVAGLGAFVGHLYPVYLRFRGGKGVATAAGVVAVLVPVPALCALLTWLAVVSAWRYVSLASLMAAGVLCTVRVMLVSEPFAEENRVLTGFCAIATGLIWLRHRENIGRLVRGNENSLKDSSFMFTLSKTLHVLALGLWFGSGASFSFVVTPIIFHTFQRPETTPERERAAWQPLLKHFDEDREKTGTRLAGAAVGPIFPWYFALQFGCGLVGAATALSWHQCELGRKTHKIRSGLLVLALLTVAVGWPLANKVGELRILRYSADTAVAAQAQADFGTWHVYSLLLNFVTFILVSIAMALAAQLPERGFVGQDSDPDGRKSVPSPRD